MGFISCSKNYYKNQLKDLESTPVTTDTIYKAKQLLKVLDDLADEGYTQLNQIIEYDFNGVSRLENYLKINHAAPFSVNSGSLKEYCVTYGKGETEIG